MGNEVRSCSGLPRNDDAFVRVHVAQNRIGNMLQFTHGALAILRKERGVQFMLLVLGRHSTSFSPVFRVVWTAKRTKTNNNTLPC